MNADVQAIAELACIKLSASEAAARQRDLEAILAYVEMLARIPTEGVEPMSHPGSLAGSLAMALRPDSAAASLPAEEALANAPAQREGMFEVPKIVERG